PGARKQWCSAASPPRRRRAEARAQLAIQYPRARELGREIGGGRLLRAEDALREHHDRSHDCQGGCAKNLCHQTSLLQWSLEDTTMTESLAYARDGGDGEHGTSFNTEARRHGGWADGSRWAAVRVRRRSGKQ